MHISLENLYVDIGSSSVKPYFLKNKSENVFSDGGHGKGTKKKMDTKNSNVLICIGWKITFPKYRDGCYSYTMLKRSIYYFEGSYVSSQIHIGVVSSIVTRPS